MQLPDRAVIQIEPVDICDRSHGVPPKRQRAPKLPPEPSGPADGTAGVVVEPILLETVILSTKKVEKIPQV